ncbi:tripartite tricarboxylate transporter permease [Cryobacterium tepidiphilum]|uniref:Tripartite tricarboxylate transporter permease n=1 Tax=Cryobacterium tepidiphilum TaxID=2486026 RepID=A0A3M8LC57_9MICO|nr:tripartite tricarboxylate transporter permease [Cryobacterium tepidiphilum]RNE62078.1 tripartite tricarboxylate transporter permease [Cryobacterium tepidiphilum]
MDVLNDLLGGFASALTLQNLLFALIGCIIGTLVGVLPGVGPVAGTAILIPLTLGMDPTSAIIMLGAIFYGSQYGGTITSVLLNTPGEAASAVTVIDGYQMTKKGRAGVALGIAAIGSFVGGTVATAGLVVAAKPLGSLGLKVGPPEFFGLMILGISLLVALAGKSMVKALLSGVIGLLIALVGIDPTIGAPRFTFGSPNLLDGVSFVAVIVGIFGLSEILVSATAQGSTKSLTGGLRGMLPNRQDLRRAAPAIGRGTVIGFSTGLVPGLTGTVTSLLSYGAESKFSRFRKQLGTGAIEGVAGPETANNAHANSALIPLFTLGIPASPTIAVLMGAFLQQGLTPGPSLFTQHSEVAWAIIASLFIGNLICLILNVPLIGVWTSILKIPHGILLAIIMIFLVVGSYTINYNVFDVFVMILFGIVGLVFRRLDIPLAPLVLTLVLGPLMERSLRESLEISQGDFSIFTRPFALTFIVIGAFVLLTPLLKIRKPAALNVDPEA